MGVPGGRRKVTPWAPWDRSVPLVFAIFVCSFSTTPLFHVFFGFSPLLTGQTVRGVLFRPSRVTKFDFPIALCLRYSRFAYVFVPRLPCLILFYYFSPLSTAQTVLGVLSRPPKENKFHPKTDMSHQEAPRTSQDPSKIVPRPSQDPQRPSQDPLGPSQELP